MKRRWLSGLCAVALLAALPAPGGDLKTHRLSVNGVDDKTAGATYASLQAGSSQHEGNGPSGLGRVSVSANGMLVVFDSEASNLEAPAATDGLPPLADTNGVSDISVHDLRTHLNRRLSVGLGGREANGPSRNPVLSPDGGYVAFESDASNLVDGDTNGVTDIFLVGVEGGEPTLVSRSDAGPANGPSRRPSMSLNAGAIAFESDASNLVPGDANGRTDVFAWISRTIEPAPEMSLVSRAQVGSANGPSIAPSISPDGRFVAFESRATNLIPGGDANGAVSDVFGADLLGPGGSPFLVSTGRAGQGNADSRAASVSGYGIVFESDATNLVPGIPDDNGARDVFFRDLASQETILVSKGGEGAAAGHSGAPAGSASGRYVAFVSDAPDLVPGVSVAHPNVFLADLGTGEVDLVSDALGPADGPSYAPALSGAGLLVAYPSDASNLVGDDTNGARDVFARVDETRCANGASETGPASSNLHAAEYAVPDASTAAHDLSCTLATLGL